jgi:hypothetical protein
VDEAEGRAEAPPLCEVQVTLLEQAEEEGVAMAKPYNPTCDACGACAGINPIPQAFSVLSPNALQRAFVALGQSSVSVTEVDV